MDTTLTPPPIPRVRPADKPHVSSQQGSTIRRFLLRIARGFKSWIFAALSCLSIPFAVVFSGWTYRLVQRRALTQWSRRLGQPAPSARILPRWIVSEDVRSALASRSNRGFFHWLGAVLRAFFGSLALNLRTGFLVVLNSFLVTLPGGMIMMFSWYAGWDNSFNKGYEQAAVGPLWGFIGIFLFMAAMTYVPIAQARQAITGSAKAFWNYRKVRDVINARPVSCLLLIAGYTALGFVFMIAVSALMFVGNADGFAEMSSSQIVAFLNSYYFWWAALFIVPGFVALKLGAGRVYSGAVLQAVTEARWRKDELVGEERNILAAASVNASPPALPSLMRTGIRAFSGIGRFTLRVATFCLLFAFAVELYIGQFFNFEPAANWLRQPMVQLPWFHSMPGKLE